MPFSSVFIVLVAISLVGTIAIPFGDPQFLDRAIALELSFITLAVLTYKGFRKALYVCIPPCNHCNGGELACIASCRDHDNILKTIQCCNSNNWWLYLAGSAYCYNRFSACKDASSHCSSKTKELDCTKDVFL